MSTESFYVLRNDKNQYRTFNDVTSGFKDFHADLAIAVKYHDLETARRSRLACCCYSERINVVRVTMTTRQVIDYLEETVLS